MTLEENKSIVRRYNQAWSEHKLEWIDELLHKNYSIWSSDKTPWELVMQGKEAAKKAIDQNYKEDPTWKVVIEDIVAESDKVAIRVTWYSNDKPTLCGMVFYRLVDGKIIDDWFAGARLMNSTG